MRINAAVFVFFVMLVAYAQPPEETEYPLMHPDKETLNKWIEAYNSAPLTHIEERKGFMVPGPGGSADLLDHLEYNASERDQGGCGNCWAWAGTGCLEIALDIQESIKDRLSTQYISSCFATDACCGGLLSDVADFYNTTKKVIPWSNENASWQDGGRSCGGSTSVSCSSISTTPNYPIAFAQEETVPTQGVGNATAIANIKNVIDQGKAVWFGFFMARGSDWTALFNFWNNYDESAIWDPSYSCGYTWGAGGGGHAVLCVGYNDTDPNNSYWIMLNSWGTTAGRPNGLFRVNMSIDYDCFYYDPSPVAYYSFYWQTLNVSFPHPAIQTSRILPSPAYANDTLLGYCNATDVDSGNVTYYYQWFLNGVLNASGSSGAYTPGIEINVNNISSGLAGGQNWTLECKANDGTFNSSALNSSVLTISTPPVIQTSTILPNPAYINSTILGYCNATDMNGDNVTYYYKWFKNGALNTSGTSASFTQGLNVNVANISSGLAVGQNWTLECEANDGTFNSSALNSSVLTISNSQPAIQTSTILPNPAYSNSTLLGYCNATDIDNDTLTYYYQWFLNGVLNTSESLGNFTQGVEINVANITSGLAVGQNWTLECKAGDETSNSSALNSSTLTISSMFPAIQFVPPTPNDGANVSGVQTINVTATDNITLDKIQILINGSSIINCSSSPCTYSWNTTSWPDGSYLINATANNTFGNSNSTSINLTVDNTLPTVQFVSPTPSNGTYNATKTINVTASDTHLDSIQIIVNGLAVINCSSSPCTYALGDGSYIFNATANDTAGNTNRTDTRNVTIDIAPPANMSIAINSNFTHTNSTSAILTLSAVGATYCRFSNTGTSYTSWEAYAAGNRGWNLTSGDGNKIVYYQCKDDVNNTGTANDSIILDTIPPSSLSIRINNNATYANSTSVALNLSATNASECRFSNDGSTYSSWVAYSTSKSWVLLAGDGNKTVYYQCRDEAGNTNASPVNDSITLDTTPPSGLSILINSGTNITNNETVSLTLTYSDNYDVDKCSYSNDGVALEWYDNTTTKSWNLSSGDGQKTVYYTCNDSAGNTGNVVWDGIMLDTSAPYAVISSPANKTYANTTVKLEFTPFDGISPTLNCSYNISGNSTNIGLLNNGELFSTDMALVNGTGYAINVSCRDGAGNRNTSETIYFAIDTGAMDAVMSSPKNISYNTNVSLQLNFTTSKPTDWAAYSLDGGATNSTLTPGSTSYSETFNVSGEGGFNLIVYANDSGGQMASDNVSFTVDMTPPDPPSVSLLPPYVSPANTTAVWVNGTSESYALVEVFVNGTANGSTTAFGDGSYLVHVSLGAGENNITARATDLAGNLGNNSTGLIVFLDTTPPAAPNITQPAARVSSSPTNVTGSAEGNATIYVYVNGSFVASANANSSGNFTAEVPLAEGNNSIRARARDIAGNLGSLSSTVYVFLDTVPPVITSLTPSDRNYTNARRPNITARFEDSSGISSPSIGMVFNGSSVTPTYNATAKTVNYTPPTNLTDGIYLVSLSVNDTLNNSASSSWSFTVDTVPPNPPTSLSATEVTDGINVSWTASNSSDVASYNIYRRVYNITNTSSATLIATVNATAAYYADNFSSSVTYWYAATAVDLAGNEGNLSNSASATFTATEEGSSGTRTSGYRKITSTYEAIDVDVGGGVTVPISVRRTLSSSEKLSNITIELKNRGSLTVYNLTYKEGIPSSVTANRNDLTFSPQPNSFETGSIVAVWVFAKLEPAEDVTLNYSVKKLVEDLSGVWSKLSATKEAPPSIQTAAISGPVEAFLDGTITLTVLVNGTEKEGLVVVVTAPSGDKRNYTTDYGGDVEFKAEEKGTYTYSVVGYTTTGITATSVKEAYATSTSGRAIITGNETASVGGNITLIVKAENGTPLVNVVVNVTTPEGEVFTLVTDENGKAAFKAEEAGTYAYSVVGYSTEGVVSTLVKTSTVLPWEEGAATGGGATEFPWMWILIAAGAILSVIFGVLLIAVILALYYFIRKGRRKGL
jgi:hypothetical protein